MKIGKLQERFIVIWVIIQFWYIFILYCFTQYQVVSYAHKIDVLDQNLDLLKNNLLKDYIQNVYIVSESENCGQTSKQVGSVISKNKLMKFCFEYYLRGNYLNVTQQQDENRSEFQSCEYKGITILAKKNMCPITEILLSSQDLIEGYESVTDFLHQNNRIFFKRQDSELQPLVDIITDGELQNRLQIPTNITFTSQELCNYQYNSTICNYQQLQKGLAIRFSIEQRYSEIKQECEKDIISFKEYNLINSNYFDFFLYFDIIVFSVYCQSYLYLAVTSDGVKLKFAILVIIDYIFMTWLYFSFISSAYRVHLLDQIGLNKDCFLNSSIPQHIFEYHMQLDIYFCLYFALALFTVVLLVISAIYLFLRQKCVKIIKQGFDNLQEEQNIQNTNNQNVIQIEQIQINQNQT